MKEYAHLAFNLRYLPVALALLGAGISVYTDVRWGKIKNFVTFPLILFGWLWGLLFGWKVAMVNVFFSCLIGCMSCLIGRVGEGDIKLIVGIAACLRPLVGFLFIAFFFMTLAVTAVFIRLKAHGFKLKPALQAMKSEALMEVGGFRDANVAVHGDKVRHIGAPVIFAALVFCLIRAKVVGLI